MLIIDLDDTIYPQSEFDSQIIRQSIVETRKYQSKSQTVDLQLLEPVLIKRRHQDRSNRVLFSEIFEDYGIERSLARHFIAAYKDYAARFEGNLSLYPSVRKDLATMKKDLPLVLATNGPHLQQLAKIRVLDIESYFDHILVLDGSPQYPLKPNPRAVLNLLSTTKGLCLTGNSMVIGDSKADLELALNLGIKYVHPTTLGWRDDE